MNILFTICGRAGSKGIKNKNIKDFLDKPLPLYALSAIDLIVKKELNSFDYDIVINTDSDELISIFKNNNIHPVNIIKRNPELGKDYVAKMDVIKNCLEIMENREKKEYDIIVDLDITSPLRTIQDILNIIEEKISTDCDLIISVTDSRRNPYFNMLKKVNDNYQRVITTNFNARQEAPETFDINGSLYVYERSFLKEKETLFDGKCGIYKMPDWGVLDLDHENDLVLMEIIGEYLINNKKEFKEIYDNIK